MKSATKPEVDALGRIEFSPESAVSELHRGGAQRLTTQGPEPGTHRLPDPRVTINVLLVAILFAAIFLDYWQYSRTFHMEPSMYMDVVAGTADAPAQYRVGVLDSASFFAMHTHLPLRYWLTIYDFICGIAGSFILLAILRRSRIYHSAHITGRWLCEIAFLAMLQYEMAWLAWYQRPETLPTTALLSFGLLCLTVPLGNGVLAPILASLGIMGFTVAQGLVRADVACAFNLGVLIVCLTQAHSSFVLNRKVQAAVSIAGAATAVAIQFFLMHVIFPHATYGRTPVVQFFRNLKPSEGYIPFLTVMLPVAWAIWRVLAKKAVISSQEAAMLIAACIFTCLWFVFGVAQEVRIFLPFGTLLIPLLVTLLFQAGNSQEQVGSAG